MVTTILYLNLPTGKGTPISDYVWGDTVEDFTFSVWCGSPVGEAWLPGKFFFSSSPTTDILSRKKTKQKVP